MMNELQHQLPELIERFESLICSAMNVQVGAMIGFDGESTKRTIRMIDEAEDGECQRTSPADRRADRRENRWRVRRK